MPRSVNVGATIRLAPAVHPNMQDAPGAPPRAPRRPAPSPRRDRDGTVAVTPRSGIVEIEDAISPGAADAPNKGLTFAFDPPPHSPVQRPSRHLRPSYNWLDEADIWL